MRTAAAGAKPALTIRDRHRSSVKCRRMRDGRVANLPAGGVFVRAAAELRDHVVAWIPRKTYATPPAAATRETMRVSIESL
jgi:hypothetical protein